MTRKTEQTENAGGEDLAAMLQRVMDEHGWNQSDLARATGIRVGTINSWVRRVRGTPSAENIQKLADGTGEPAVKWAEASGRRVPAPLDSNGEQYILSLWHKMTPAEQRLAAGAWEGIVKSGSGSTS